MMTKCSHSAAFGLASLLLLFLHLPLLGLAKGEFTDGVLQSVYFDDPIYARGEGVPPARYVPPLYPFSIEVLSASGLSRDLAGRLVSMAAYSICAFWIAVFARRIGKQLFPGAANDSPHQAGWIGWTAWLYWSLSPMANRWSFHYMSDMLFCCLSVISLGYFIESTRKNCDRLSSWVIGNLAGVAALWTRFQGVALAAVSLGTLLFVISQGRAGFKEDEGSTAKRSEILVSMAVVLFWVVSIVALSWGGGIHAGQFAERSRYPWSLYLNFAFAGLQYLPYAVTPPLFLLMLVGFYLGFRKGGKSLCWCVAGVLAGLAGLILHTFFLSFQFRYGLPFLPWVAVLAALGTFALPFRYRIPLTALALLWLTAMTGAVLTFQHKTFADIEEVCEKVPLIAEQANNVWGFEEYNWKPDGSLRYGNVKFSIWSQRPVLWLGEEELQQVREGDLIIQSNVYPSIPPGRLDRLRKKWRLVPVAEAFSETIPLFPGEVLWVPYPTPSGTRMIRGTSDPQLMKYRFKKQFYSTVLYRVEPRKQGGSDSTE